MILADVDGEATPGANKAQKSSFHPYLDPLELSVLVNTFGLWTAAS